MSGHVELTVAAEIEALAYDPQTSGGLLAAVEPAAVGELAAVGFVEIGEVTAGEPAVSLQ